MTVDLSPRTEQHGTGVIVAVASERGLVRSEQQDAAVCGSWMSIGAGARATRHARVEHVPLLLAVVDGMGGHAGGALAAGVAAAALAHLDPDGTSDWRTTFERISDRVGAAGTAWGMPDMGATAAVAVVHADHLEVAGVGDCRVMRWVDGYLGTLTVEDRAPDPRQPGGRVVTQSLGGPPRALNPHEDRVPHPVDGCRYVLCSDGLHDAVTEADLRDVLSREMPAAATADALVDAAYAAGAPDNVTVLVVDVEP